MNRIILLGRVSQDPKAGYSKAGKAFTRFSVAVDRPYTAGQEKKADFFDCVAFGKTAEMVGNYFQKGKGIMLEGSVQFNEYTNKAGQKARATNVFVNHVEFVPGVKKSADKSNVGASEGFGEAFGTVVPEDFDVSF